MEKDILVKLVYKCDKHETAICVQVVINWIW